MTILSYIQYEVAIAAEGAMPPLVALLSSGDADGKANAVGVLGSLSNNVGNQVTTATEGAISTARGAPEQWRCRWQGERCWGTAEPPSRRQQPSDHRR